MAVTHRRFVSYIDRTRDYYAAQGYDRPYAWAHHDEVPFARLQKPLAESRIGLVTTASLDLGQQPVAGVLRGDKQVYSAPVEPLPERLFTDDLSWDKEATHTEDLASFLPVTPLRSAAEAGRIGSLATRFHGVPTDYSQRRTSDEDAPEILARLREDAADIALLVPL